MAFHTRPKSAVTIDAGDVRGHLALLLDARSRVHAGFGFDASATSLDFTVKDGKAIVVKLGEEKKFTEIGEGTDSATTETVTLTASDTNHVFVDESGEVTANTTGTTPTDASGNDNAVKLYEVVTDAQGVDDPTIGGDITDFRDSAVGIDDELKAESLVLDGSDATFQAHEALYKKDIPLVEWHDTTSGQETRTQLRAKQGNLEVVDIDTGDGTVTVQTTDLRNIDITLNTQGSVPFAASDGTLTEDNANLFYDDTNNRLGVGTSSPSRTLEVGGPVGLTNGNNLFLDKAGTATSGTSHDSGDLVLRGSGWDGAAAADRDVRLRTLVDDGAQTYRLGFLDDAGAEFVTFEGDTQRVGIGTTTPTAGLEVSGATKTTTLEATGTSTLTGDVTLQQANQDYIITGSSNVSTALRLVAQGTNANSQFVFESGDSDGTEVTSIWLQRVGIFEATDEERVGLFADNSGPYKLKTVASGTGSHRPIKIESGGNTDQLVLNTDGNVGIGTDSPGVLANGNEQGVFDVRGNGRGQFGVNAGEVTVANGGNAKIHGAGSTVGASLLMITAGDPPGDTAVFLVSGPDYVEIADPSGNWAHSSSPPTYGVADQTDDVNVFNESGGSATFRYFFLGCTSPA